MCPIQTLDPMRSRAGQRVKPRFFNGPPKEAAFDQRFELLVVGDFFPVEGHRDRDRGGKTFPCLGDECAICRQKISSPEPYEYIGVLLNGNSDSPRSWCVPPEWSHQLGEQPWLWQVFTTWKRRDGTIRIERSRRAPVVVDYPMIDVWSHCIETWGLTVAQAGPRPVYECPKPTVYLPVDSSPEPTTRTKLPLGFSLKEMCQLSPEERAKRLAELQGGAA